MRRIPYPLGVVQDHPTKFTYLDERPIDTWSRLFRISDDPEVPNLCRVAEYYKASPYTLELFCKLAGNSFLTALRRVRANHLKLKRDTVIVAAKDQTGQVCGITTWDGQWISEPCLHVINPKRAYLGIHLTSTIIEAELLAESLNHCVVALGGLSETAVYSLFPARQAITILSRTEKQEEAAA